jgi:hypothetical protein
MKNDERNDMDETTSQPGPAAAAADLEARVRPQLEAARRRLDGLTTQVKALVDEHPALSLLAAAALGFVIARAIRPPRR